MANESVAEAQSLPSAAPAGELTFTPESQQAPLTVPLAEQFGNLNSEQLQAVIDKLGGDTGREMSGPGAPIQPLREPSAPVEATTTTPESVVEVPVEEVSAVVPPVEPADPVENPPGRIRIDRITDERTRQILEFQSRNHDATIEDAIAFVDGQRQDVAPAPQTTPTGPDLAGIQTRIADLTNQLKAKSREALVDDSAAEAAEDLRNQLMDARVDLRFAQEQANRQQASVYQQRADTRAASVNTALEMCPEVNDLSTPQGKEFTRIADEYKAKNDPILQNDNLPTLIALQVMHATGYTTKAPAAAPAPVAPVAPPAPAKPTATVRTTVPVARTTPPAPATAPGNTGLTQASAPSLAQLEAALSSADSNTLELIMAKAGEKLAPTPMPYSRA